MILFLAFLMYCFGWLAFVIIWSSVCPLQHGLALSLWLISSSKMQQSFFLTSYSQSPPISSTSKSDLTKFHNSQYLHTVHHSIFLSLQHPAYTLPLAPANLELFIDYSSLLLNIDK